MQTPPRPNSNPEPGSEDVHAERRRARRMMFQIREEEQREQEDRVRTLRSYVVEANERIRTDSRANEQFLIERTYPRLIEDIPSNIIRIPPPQDVLYGEEGRPRWWRLIGGRMRPAEPREETRERPIRTEEQHVFDNETLRLVAGYPLSFLRIRDRISKDGNDLTEKQSKWIEAAETPGNVFDKDGNALVSIGRGMPRNFDTLTPEDIMVRAVCGMSLPLRNVPHPRTRVIRPPPRRRIVVDSDSEDSDLLFEFLDMSDNGAREAQAVGREQRDRRRFESMFEQYRMRRRIDLEDARDLPSTQVEATTTESAPTGIDR